MEQPAPPVMFAIVGDSAAGKTTLASGIAAFLGSERVLEICTDDYHRYDRTERKVRAITPLNPDCNYLDVLERHLGVLAAGKPVLKPVYHHTHGTLERPEYVAPRQYVIVEGLLGLHTAAMRSHYDVSVYLDPPEELRHAWKVKRDTTKRNYTREAVLAELETREEDSARFIRPQRDEADIVVRFFPPETDEGDARGRFNVRLLLRSRLPHPDLTDVLAIAMGDPPPLRWSVLRESGRLTEVVEIDGDVPDDVALEMEDCICAHLAADDAASPADVRAYLDAQTERPYHALALTQLLIVYHLLTAQCVPQEVAT